MDLDSDNPLAIEIRQEMAASYFAACKKMVASLGSLRAFDRALGPAIRDKAQIVRRSELLEEAAERVHFVVIQREAMNISCFDQFFDDYEIPDEVRTRMGPKQPR